MVDAARHDTKELRPAAPGSIRLWAVKTTAAIGILAAALLISAGTLRWGMAWIYLFVMLVGQGLSGLILVRGNAGLLEERSRLHPGYKKWDVPLATFLVWAPVFVLVVAGLEHRQSSSREDWPVAGLAGLCVTAAGYALTTWAMFVNRFFAPVVRIQTERGHSVVDRGPYRVVRHPGYVGFIAYAAGTALALGSVRAFVPVAAIVLIVILRTFLEDRTLQRELDGYGQYAARVRYRLLPGIW